MTVGELINLLLKYPSDMQAVTRGFDEAGIDDIERVEIRNVKFWVRAPGLHVGPHDEHPEGIPAVWIDW